MTQLGLAQIFKSFVRYLAGLKPGDRMNESSSGRAVSGAGLNFRLYILGEDVPSCYITRSPSRVM